MNCHAPMEETEHEIANYFYERTGRSIATSAERGCLVLDNLNINVGKIQACRLITEKYNINNYNQENTELILEQEIRWKGGKEAMDLWSFILLNSQNIINTLGTGFLASSKVKQSINISKQ